MDGRPPGDARAVGKPRIVRGSLGQSWEILKSRASPPWEKRVLSSCCPRNSLPLDTGRIGRTVSLTTRRGGTRLPLTQEAGHPEGELLQVGLHPLKTPVLHLLSRKTATQSHSAEIFCPLSPPLHPSLSLPPLPSLAPHHIRPRSLTRDA